MKDARYLTRGGFGGFMLLVLCLHFIKPWVNPLQRGLAEYTVGNFGVLMIVAFFVLGFGFLGLALQPVVSFRNKTAGYICSMLFLVSAFASLILGAFPTIPAGAPSVTSALIHNQTAPILVISSLLAMSMYTIEIRYHRPLKRYFKLCLSLVTIAWVAFFMLSLTGPEYGYKGLLQRITVLSTWMWIILCTFRLNPR